MSADVNENDMSGPNLIEVSSPDSGVTFSVDNDKFEIETVGSASVLKLKDGMYLDHEGTGGMVTLMITATDAMDNPSMSTAVTINVGDVNEAPMISVMDSETPDGMTAAASIMENAAGVPVGEIMVSDYDMADQDLSDMITVSDDRFEVSKDAEGGLWLKLKDGVSLDHETDPMVTVTVGVTDTGTNGMAESASTDVVVTVGNVNEGPTISVVDSMTPDGMPARSNIPENQAGVPVGEIMISDPDMADNMLGEDNLTLSGEHAMYFELDTDDMGGIWLKLKDGVSLNYEEMSSVMVTVTVTDNGMATDMAMVTVTVGNVNEPPSISVGEAMIDENTTGRVGIVTVTDNEEMRDITLDVEDIKVVGAGSPFRVIEDGMGDYVLELTRPIDFESDDVMKDDDFTGTVEVVLEVTDEGGLKDTETISVVINNVDEAPMISVEDDGDAVSSIAENSNADAEVPVGRIDASDPENGDFDMNGVTLSGADAESFYVRPDDEGVLWLVLKEGVSADHEGDGGSLEVTLSVDDGTNAAESTEFMLTINDVNERPMVDRSMLMHIVKEDTDKDPSTEPVDVAKTVPDFLSWTAGGARESYKLDVTDVFMDEDEGDMLFVYSVQNAPTWLDVGVTRSDDNVYINLSGNPPSTDTQGSWSIDLVAADQGGMSNSITLQMIADDGNDAVTGIKLTGVTDPEFPEVEENDMSGPVIGYLEAMDLDDENHAHGTHTWTQKNSKLEIVELEDGRTALMVKKGSSIDFEGNKGELTVEITATDGGKLSLTREFTVNIKDNNDKPTEENPPGNWWVTVDKDLDADEVEAGDWLSFSLETETATKTDLRQLFDDVDAGDTLTYSIVSGPAWLEIDGVTGALQNVKEMLPTRGVHDVMVRATDKSGTYANAEFQIAVVLSDDDNADNDEPDIKSDGKEIDENSGAGTVVATITVEDKDLDVGDIHPWGDLTIVVTATATVNGAENQVLQSAEAFMNTNSKDDFVKLVPVSSDDDSVTYNIVLTGNQGTQAIDAEQLSEVELTVTAYDGTVTGEFSGITSATDGADVTEFDFKIEDVNEAPALVVGELAENHSSEPLQVVNRANVYPVLQQQPADDQSSVHTIYLNLSRLFDDPDEDHDDGDNSFVATINSVPWLKVARNWDEDAERFTTGAVQWESIKDGRDEDAGTDDDAVWGPGADEVSDDDWVLILEVDRTGDDPVKGSTNPRPDSAEIEQGDNGLITIVAMDEDGEKSTTNIAVTITDENLHPTAAPAGVRVSDTTPHEKQTITASFNESVDPDFTGPNKGSPVAVILQVINVEDGSETIVDASVGNSVQYKVKQSDVGDALQFKAVYYELFSGNIVPSNPDNAALETVTKTVEDRQDPAKITFTFSTDSDNKLVASTNSQAMWDADGLPDSPEIKYTWERSDNGRTGWQVFDADGTVDNPDADQDTNEATIPDTLVGKHVRLVVTFEDKEGRPERVASESVKVGAINTVDVVPTINTGSEATTGIPVGRTLKVDLEGVAPTGGRAVVEWMAGSRKLGEGAEYKVTESDLDATITVRITSYDSKGNVTSIVTTPAGVSTVTSPPNSGPISPEPDHVIDLGAAPEKEGDLVYRTAMVDMASLFEDAEGSGLTFRFANPSNFEEDSIDGTASLDVYHDANGDGGDQLLIIDESTGEVRYYTTKSQDHGADNTQDGAGNMITSVLTATDARAASDGSATVNVQFRIDAAPTGFHVGTDPAALPTANADGVDSKPYGFEATGNTLVENADPGPTARDGSQPNQQTAVRVNVLDLNDSVGPDAHVYGEYTITVDDDRFEVVPDFRPGNLNGDRSMATIRLKSGEKLDFETTPGPLNNDQNKEIVIVVTATPDSGNFDPIKVGITIQVSNVVEPTDPTEPTPEELANKVPGLKDDETDDDSDDDTVDDDDNADGDEDGGTPDPMDAMATFASSLDGGLF